MLSVAATACLSTPVSYACKTLLKVVNILCTKFTTVHNSCCCDYCMCTWVHCGGIQASLFCYGRNLQS